MSTEILMPALSPTMEEGKLSKWLVKEGDTVKSGTILAEIETDKATMEFEAVDEGKIGKILVPEGSEGVKVNAPIAVLLDEGEKLAADGIEAEVIDLRTLRPLDMDTVLESVKKTNRIVTMEQAWPVCSIGSEICARVALDAFDYLDAPPTKVSGKDVPMPYAANLEKLALPTVDDLIQAVKAVSYKA
jgi:pyruvate/2-oxoglutarate dehydrogenase complex dihydrolipoamide acyltransferase (E2) component